MVQYLDFLRNTKRGTKLFMKICIVRNFTDERDEGVRIVGREIAMHFQNSELTVKKINIYSKLWNQNTTYNGRIFTIWRLRIGTRFKYKQQYSRKILRIYGGGDCLP